MLLSTYRVEGAIFSHATHHKVEETTILKSLFPCDNNVRRTNSINVYHRYFTPDASNVTKYLKPFFF
jgi:hypothetical protein